MLADNRISISPIGFLKGRTFNSAYLVLDESEDLTVEELRMVITRLGKFSTLLIIGDIQQSNIRNSGFETVFQLFNNQESKDKGIHTFEFDKSDILRNEVLTFVIDKFDSLKS